ncbi:MAG: type I-E CRISPR-associated protein Cse1/CasA [Sulfuricella sp.]|nr:type I-E CRISPR-associated protein Cse1/CasA [Sulfuricella sp.]
MNVAFDPWIPVIVNSGKRELASLYAVLAEGEKFADLAVRPHERVALMRLFLCVVHAALKGPKDYDEWCEVPKRLPDAVRTYLTDWKDSFELFHEKKPWLQVAELNGVEKEGGESGKTSPVALLDFELATGNNSTLNDHGGQMGFRPIKPERIALNLLTFQNFSSGGGSPVAQWKMIKTSQVGNPDAPCLSQSMAHCLFRGRSVAETLHFNLPTFETIGNAYRAFSTDKKKGDSYSDLALGRPVWENFPKSPEKEVDGVINATKTYIGRLVPISRWIRLIHDSDQMYCCNGFKYDTYKDGFPSEPTAAVRVITKKDKKGIETTERRVVKVEPTRALWRELSSLLVKRSADGLGGPLAMVNAPNTEFDFHVCAIIRDQASMDIAVESVFHIAPAFQANFPIYQAEVIRAEERSRKLRWAIEDYRSTIDNDWISRVKRTQAKEQSALKDKLAQGAFLSYWTAVEKNLPLLMTHIEAIGTDAAIPTREAWRKMLFSAACDAYRIVCGQETPRQMRAFAKGWHKLTTKKDKPELNTQETKEVEL